MGRSFQFTALPFGIVTAPLEFVRVAPHSSVDHWLYTAAYTTYLLVEIEAISGLCTETTLGDKLSKSELIPTNCPHRRKVGYLRSLWMVYIQVCQPFQNSNVIYSILESIKY